MRRTETTWKPQAEQLEDRVALSHGFGGVADKLSFKSHSHENASHMREFSAFLPPVKVQLAANFTLHITGTKYNDTVRVVSNVDRNTLTVTWDVVDPGDPLHTTNGGDEFDFAEVSKIWFKGGKGLDSFDGANAIKQIYANGGKDNDRLEGGDFDDVLKGNAGDDSLLGGGGSDFLMGFSGEDLLEGGFGYDLLVGGKDREIDLLAGYLYLVGGDDTADWLYLEYFGGDLFDYAWGSDPNDVLFRV
jgi:Ca2+-binding RTX toxin-like protein